MTKLQHLLVAGCAHSEVKLSHFPYPLSFQPASLETYRLGGLKTSDSNGDNGT